MAYVAIGGVMREVRRISDLSQRELADQSGVSRRVIEGLEVNHGSGPHEALPAILRATGLALALVQLDEDEDEDTGNRAAPERPRSWRDGKPREQNASQQGLLRDRAYRRFPAHLDVRPVDRFGEWWGDWPLLSCFARPDQDARRPAATFDLNRSRSRRDERRRGAPGNPSTMAPMPLTSSPDLVTFRELAATRRVIPVTRRLLADGETPLSVYRKLAAGRPGTFLLESAELGGVWSRYSFIGARCHATLTEHDGQARWLGAAPVGVPLDGDPLVALKATLEVLHTERLPDLPPLTGGLVGYIGYDAVRRLERLPDLAVDDLQIPEIGMMMATDLAVLDHSDGSVLLIANAVNYDATDDRVDWAHQDAVQRLDAMTADLSQPAEASVMAYDTDVEPAYLRRRSEAEHAAAITRAIEEIKAGEAFQVVVSQRFEMQTEADALDVYRMLRVSNPSPYMYLLRFDGFDVVGSSPEALVKVTSGRAMVHPIAGTRWRGETPERDAELAAELLADPKERAEHLMLVDLGRNDLGRVCRPGSVDVVDFMSVERYSHVMHIVSTVVGEVSPTLTAYDVLAACFPAGTLSGAPKPRAMEIIEELEPTRRGLYGGCVGYLDFAGDADTAIAIRTALIRKGVAYVQAGGGIVADSDPVAEDAECRNKAMAVLRAVATAGTLRAVSG